MPVTHSGLKAMIENTVGQGTIFDAANCKVAVGDGGAAFEITQTNLQGASKVAKSVSAGYPLIVEDNKIQVQAQFGADEANFNWNEWGIFNGAPGSGTMLSRSTDSLGRKVQGQTWVITATVEFILV